MTEYFHWHGRDDGPGDEHARWFTTIIDAEAEPVPPNAITLVGFASDTGVARNHGRVGAATGPTAIREALASLAIHDDRVRADAHTITYTNTSDLEAGQQQLSDTVAALLDNGSGTVVTLGGGHETSWASHRGLRQSHHGDGKSIAIINLDAHFDLRTSDIATSGTPFKQIADAWPHDFHYTVLGISEPNNTRVLFQTADQLGVTSVTDDALADLSPAEAAELVTKAAATAARDGEALVVGSYGDVARELAGLASAAEDLVVTGSPQLEESWRLGESLPGLLAREGVPVLRREPEDAGGPARVPFVGNV